MTLPLGTPIAPPAYCIDEHQQIPVPAILQIQAPYQVVAHIDANANANDEDMQMMKKLGSLLRNIREQKLIGVKYLNPVAPSRICRRKPAAAAASKAKATSQAKAKAKATAKTKANPTTKTQTNAKTRTKSIEEAATFRPQTRGVVSHHFVQSSDRTLAKAKTFTVTIVGRTIFVADPHTPSNAWHTEYHTEQIIAHVEVAEDDTVEQTVRSFLSSHDPCTYVEDIGTRVFVSHNLVVILGDQYLQPDESWSSQGYDGMVVRLCRCSNLAPASFAVDYQCLDGTDPRWH